MAIRLYGPWRLTVIEAVHNWENRFVVSGASSGNGTYPPSVGTTVSVNGSSWRLDAQHQPPGEAWTSSAMNFEPSVPEQVAVNAMIGAEDPLPTEDFRDIRWEGVFLGPSMVDLPYRPYAVRTTDLFQMPDGIFETALGTYYMGVRVTNTWGVPLSSSHVLDITATSRTTLAGAGVVVIDEWSASELASLSQEQTGTGMVLGPLEPDDSTTVFFKVDVSRAAPRKHAVEFTCQNVSGTADPHHPGRRVTKSILVSRTSHDPDTGEFVFDAQEGSLRLTFDEVVYDREGYRRNRRRLREAATSGSARCKADLEQIRKALREFLAGEPVDICRIYKMLACCCIDGPDGRPTPVYEPFYVVPTRFRATFVPRSPFGGTSGPLLFEDPWWKLALLILAVILLILGALEESGQSAYEDEDFVIGTLFTSRQHHLDAALCLIDTSRDLSFLTVLDAQSDEDNQVPVMTLDGNVTGLDGNVMTRAEIDALLLDAATSGDTTQLRVFKSGARTGLTFADITRFSGPWTRDDDGTRFDDPDRPTIEFEDPAGGSVSDKGDSGSVWIHLASRRIIALNHSGNDTTAFGSLMTHVVDALTITF